MEKKELVVNNVIDLFQALLSGYKPIEFFLGEEKKYVGWDTTECSLRYGEEKSKYVMEKYFRKWELIQDIVISGLEFIMEISSKYGTIKFSLNNDKTNKVKLVKIQKR